MATQDSVKQFARSVWLAGLGAYGKSAETLSKSLDKAYEESNQLFNELVVKGAEVQATLEAKIKEQSHFESKVDEVREKLGLSGGATDKQIDELTAKVDDLTTIVAQLAERRLAEQAVQATQAAETAEMAKEIAKTAEAAESAEHAVKHRKSKAKGEEPAA